MQAVCFKAKIYKGKFTSTIHAFPLTVDYTVRQSALHLSGLWQLWRINIEKKKKKLSKLKTVLKRYAQ